MIHRLLQGALRRAAGIVFRRAGTIVLLSLIVTAVAAWLTATKLRVINDTSNLIRADSDANKDYLAYAKEFDADDEYVVIIRSDDVEKNREAIRWIGPRMEAMQPGIRRVMYHFDFSHISEHFLLFLNPDELKKVEEEVGGYATQMRQANVRLDLNSMLDETDRMFNDKYLRKKDNWKEFKPFVDRFVDMLNQLADSIEGTADKAPGKTGGKGGKRPPSLNASPVSNQASSHVQDQLQDIDRVLAEHEYPGLQGGKVLLVSAVPGPVVDSERPYGKTTEDLRKLLVEARAAFPGVEFGLTGLPVLSDDELQTSSADSLHAGLLALVLVVILMAVGYRARTRPFVAIGVLLMGVCWSLGFTVITVGHLNIISQAFVAMVIGLGIDFGIQIMGRYEEELGKGANLEQALVASIGHTGVAVVTGGSTTAIAFYTMCFNDFVGLSEFGIVAGSGVLLCLLANLFLLPACYVLLDRRKSPQVLRETGSTVSSEQAAKINAVLFSRPGLVLSVAAAVTVGAAFLAPKVGFDYNTLHLQNPKIDSVRELHRLNDDSQADKESGNSESLLYAVSVADSIDDAKRKIAAFKALPTVADVRCPPVDLIPTDAASKAAIIKRIVDSLQGLSLSTDVKNQVDVERARTKISSLLADCTEGVAQAKKFAPVIPQAREAVEVLGKLIPPLTRAQAAMAGLSQDELGKRLNRYQISVFGTMQRNLAFLAKQKTTGTITSADIPAPLRDRYLSPNGKLLIEVVPKENIWDREPDARFVKELRTVDPHVTGMAVQNYEYIDLLRASYVKAAQWAFVAIVVLISLHFRKPGLIALAIFPLVIAILWTVGMMRLFGFDFNPANIVTLPLVIGIGVAYGVYTVDRCREDGGVHLFEGSTGKAIFLSALTAMIGFGSMMVSKYTGLFSLGFLMFAGVGMCLITSLLVAPQILVKWGKKE
ncbi:hypothetical protein SAMN05444156_2396 [Verrucomicrobium sp. GAS474]|uniref:MMPL family transporter n=1 Tax=Verrucomicrobium sp. GAS474 TaxID=1882831 RepID=UPI000879EFE7|nr:MMPL family transporter [Verrucomicrobium sp. GAS474]SDU17201.1 hypothetical protein SAMN05444156_2396 [Verrucomicrobium sp. GAS474]